MEAKLKSLLVKRNVITILFFVACVFTSRAQINPPNPTVPSANLAATKQSIEVTSDLFNGRANISVPLYQMDFEGIQFPLSLNYAGGNGIKPDELPSWVGLGWGLQAGGTVHRTVRGKPDEALDFETRIHVFSSGTTSPKKQTLLHTTDFSYMANTAKLAASNWSTQAYANTLAPSQNNLPIYGQSVSLSNHHPTYDLVPDEFSFSFGNISGKFYLNHQNKWIVQSNDGQSYSIHVETGPQTMIDYPVPATQGRVFYQVPRIIKYFALTSSSGVKYYFGNTNVNAPINEQQFEYSHSSVVFPNSFEVNPPYQYTSGNEAPTYIDVVPHTWHLTKIENLKTGSTVTFNYKWGWQFYKVRQAWGRGGTNTTGGFVVHDNSTFYSNPENLNSVYNLSAIAKVLTKAWTLESIIFSNGTKMEFSSTRSTQLSTSNYVNEAVNFSFHQYEDVYHSSPSISGQQNALFQLNKILISFGGKVQKEINFDYSLSPSQRLQLTKVKEKGYDNYFANEYSFSYNNSTALPGYGLGKNDHWGFYNNQDFFASVSAPYDVYSKLLDYTNYRAPSLTYTQAEILTKVEYPTKGYVELTYELNTYSKAKTNFSITDHSTNKNGGGVRIKKLSYYSGNNILASETEYDYTIPGSTLSSGVLAIPEGNYLTGNAALFEFSAGGYNPTYYEGNNVTYTYVTEKQPGNGKTVHEHTNYDNGYNDAGQIEGNNTSGGWRFEYAYANKAFKRGRPKTIKQYKESGAIVKETTLGYEHDNSESNKDELRSLYLGVFASNNHYGSISQRIYQDHITSKEEKTYNDNGNIIEKQTTSYDAYGNIRETKLYDSKGKVLREKYKYNYEYASTGTDNISLGIKFLNDLGIKDAVVEKLSIMENPDGSNANVTGASLFTYRTSAAFLDKKYALRITAPFPESNFTTSGIPASLFVKDSRYATEPEIEANSYDSKGNILQTTSEGARKKSYIWDYSSTYLIAECSNAQVSDIAYTSFEADGNGNWTISGAARNSEGFAGRRSYNLSAGNISKSGLSSGTAYTISLWVKNSNPLIAGSGTGVSITSWITRKTVDGWRLIECSATGVTGITLSGSNSTVDELRLFPRSATMTSYTYEPLVGISSKSDAGNYISFYEYDEFSRLILIKDQDKNILKTYCYNYAGQSENCNVYYNDAVSGSFAPDCPYGVGVPVTYSVPAKKHLSTQSQEIANQKAAADLAANGQAYANANGSCTVVYVRLERTQDYYHSDSYSTIESTTYLVRFYSDAQGTIPMALPSNININYHLYTHQSGSNYDYIYNMDGIATGEQGLTEYDFGYTELINCIHNQPYASSCTTVSISLNPGKYIIIY